MLVALAHLLSFFAFLFFAAKRLLTYLHVFQQEEYDSPRFLRWMVRRRVFDKRLSAVLMVAGVAVIALIDQRWLADMSVLAAFLVFALTENDPRQLSKKKLVLTPRATRIYAMAMVLCVALAAGTFFYAPPLFAPLVWIVAVQMIPLMLPLANYALDPYEKAVQHRFMAEAQEKLREMKPKIVGITGSYGKTSVKHILGHILQNAAPTLITPGSVNTPMGITRIIREQLTARHKYFVVEMGAYGPGSIARLCALTPPDAGIITAIGHAHYERFKTLETVAGAKFELARAVLDAQGKVIVNAQTLSFESSAPLYKEHKDAFVVCGTDAGSDIVLGKIEQDRGGLHVDITMKGDAYRLDAPLYGLHHGANMAIAFAAACALGIDPRQAALALKTAPQIEHRLEVRPQGAGFVIDDAYNSNPAGFESALALLGLLGQGRRKILITPGMVELGAAHDEQHARLGALAATHADIVLAVRAERIPSFVSAFRGNANETQILIEVASFAEASVWQRENGQDGDVVLIENDLPDLYEAVPRI